MSQQATSAVSQPQLIETLSSRTGAPNAPAMTEELLPFTVRLVRDEDDLNKAVQIRHSAYARHLPDFAETLKDVYPGMGYIPFSHVGGLPHRVMSLEVDSVEPSWAAAKQPLYEFFFHTHLPDHPKVIAHRRFGQSQCGRDHLAGDVLRRFQLHQGPEEGHRKIRESGSEGT